MCNFEEAPYGWDCQARLHGDPTGIHRQDMAWRGHQAGSPSWRTRTMARRGQGGWQMQPSLQSRWENQLLVSSPGTQPDEVGKCRHRAQVHLTTKKPSLLYIQQIVIAVILKYAFNQTACEISSLLFTGWAGQTALTLQLYVSAHFVLLENSKMCWTAKWAICLQNVFLLSKLIPIMNTIAHHYWQACFICISIFFYTFSSPTKNKLAKTLK